MFPRVLAVMLAGVVAVQLANFALLQFVPLPQPPMFSVAHVAAALRSGQDTDHFRTRLSLVPPIAGHGRAIGLSVALASDLGAVPDAVRLSFVDPPGMGGPPGDEPRRRPALDGQDSLLIGDFTAGLRQSNGRWITVRPVHSGMHAWRSRLFLWLFAALLTVTPFAWLLARWVTRPIATFADAAERIGRNPHTEPMAATGPAEIAHAARIMNEMQARLTRFVDDRTLMIGAIAHDLRTPLMRLALRLEHAPDHLRHGVDRDIADMQAMIAAAMKYVRGATMTATRQRLDLASLAETAVLDLADRGESAIFLPGERVVIDGDPVALRAVVDNLLTNALRYAGDAEVSVCRTGASAVMEVRDHGPGLVDEDIARAFDPFFRGEESRNRDTGGLGLGLASVRGVVHLHGGEVSLRNHPEGGLLARVELPV
ncbi:MAG: ATP-binding protein [Janthinobacterium lividum]